MDPFSLALGTFGITNSAISSIRGLRRVINDVSGARELVGDTDQDLEGILVPLDALQKLRPHNEDISRASQQALKETGLADAVNKCAEACNVLAEKIRESTRHSSDSTKLSLRDRVTVGILNKEKIQTFRTRVKCSLSIVQYAVQSTQLIVQLRFEESSNNDREITKQKLQALEANIKSHIDLTIEQNKQLQLHMQELQRDAEHDAISEVKEQSRLLDENEISVGVIYSQVRAAWSGQQIGNVLTDQRSKALVGMPQSIIGKINQRIGNVNTRGQSNAAVGVFPDDANMGSFWNNPT